LLSGASLPSASEKALAGASISAMGVGSASARSSFSLVRRMVVSLLMTKSLSGLLLLSAGTA